MTRSTTLEWHDTLQSDSSMINGLNPRDGWTLSNVGARDFIADYDPNSPSGEIIEPHYYVGRGGSGPDPGLGVASIRAEAAA